MRKYWRVLLSRAPLPMLALAASYGVYSYALLFTPAWVALVQAAAFECTYLGLAVLSTHTERERRRATLISIGAVLASIIYNSLAGWFHRVPDLLAGASDVAWLALAALHGAPLAWVAFLVSDLLLHTGAPMAHHDAPEQHHGAPLVSIQQVVAPQLAQMAHREALPFDEAAELEAPALSPEERMARAVALATHHDPTQRLSVKAAARQWDVPESTLGRRVKAIKEGQSHV